MARVGGYPGIDVIARLASPAAGEAESDMPCLAVGAVAQFQTRLPLAAMVRRSVCLPEKIFTVSAIPLPRAA